jgi:cytoskeletal protein CcmA (bactofilin family)
MKALCWSTLLVIPLFLWGCSGDNRNGVVKRVVLPADEVHEGWYFASGDQVIIQGTVNGDVYVAGGMVQVDGTVNGDLLAAGGAVVINGRVSDDVRAAGGNVECNGSVGKNFTVAGGNVRLSRGAQVGGGVLAAGGEIRIGGAVREQVMLTGGEAQIEGEVGGDVRFVGGGITTLPGASIDGDLRAKLENPDRAQISPGTVKGSVELITERKEARGTIMGFSVMHFWFKILWALSLIVAAVVLIMLFPRSVDETGRVIWEHPWWSLLWGFVGIGVIPLAVIALCVTVIGIPVGLMVLMLYFWALYLSQLALGIVFGQRVFVPGSTGTLLLAAIAGIVLVQVLTFVPYLGILLIAAGALLGLGGILEVVRGRLVPRENMSPPLA